MRCNQKEGVFSTIRAGELGIVSEDDDVMRERGDGVRRAGPESEREENGKVPRSQPQSLTGSG